MSGDKRVDGVPVRVGKVPGSPRPVETWVGANQASDEKIRVRKLERRARDNGYEIRHADSGYALIDPARQAVDGRRDLNLRDVSSLLNEALKA